MKSLALLGRKGPLEVEGYHTCVYQVCFEKCSSEFRLTEQPILCVFCSAVKVGTSTADFYLNSKPEAELRGFRAYKTRSNLCLSPQIPLFHYSTVHQRPHSCKSKSSKGTFSLPSFCSKGTGKQGILLELMTELMHWVDDI